MANDGSKDPIFLFLAEVPDYIITRMVSVGRLATEIQLRFRRRGVKFSHGASLAIDGIDDDAAAHDVLGRVVEASWAMLKADDVRLELRLILQGEGDAPLLQEDWSMAPENEVRDSTGSDLVISNDMMKLVRQLTAELRLQQSQNSSLIQVATGSVLEVVKARGDAESRRWEHEVTIEEMRQQTARMAMFFDRLPMFARLLRSRAKKKTGGGDGRPADGEVIDAEVVDAADGGGDGRPAWIDEALEDVAAGLTEEAMLAKYNAQLRDADLLDVLGMLTPEEVKALMSAFNLDPSSFV